MLIKFKSRSEDNFFRIAKDYARLVKIKNEIREKELSICSVNGRTDD
jgi:hypothetical protein